MARRSSGDGLIAVLIIGAVVGIFTLIGYVLKSIFSTLDQNSKEKTEKLKLEEERSKKFKDRTVDKALNLFERNKDIIENHKCRISSSSTQYRYYYIENMTRDCINDICLAEEKYNLSPKTQYLSTWKNTAPEEWKQLAAQIEKTFYLQQRDLTEAENNREKERQEEASLFLSSKYGDLINQFNDIAYRKVTTIDDYGEENWEALERETSFIIEKIAKKEGIAEEEIKRWKKNSWSIPMEYKKLSEKLTSQFKNYYQIRKSKSFKDENIAEMSGIEFENHLAQLLRANGFQSVTGTPTTGDQGADLIAKKNGKTIIIQAKRYKSTVGNKAVQEVMGAVSFYNGDEGWVITNSTFTRSARELANKSGIKLIDGIDMQQFADTLNG